MTTVTLTVVSIKIATKKSVEIYGRLASTLLKLHNFLLVRVRLACGELLGSLAKVQGNVVYGTYGL